MVAGMFWSIARLWRTILKERYYLLRLSTTRTEKEATTELRIFKFLRELHIRPGMSILAALPVGISFKLKGTLDNPVMPPNFFGCSNP